MNVNSGLRISLLTILLWGCSQSSDSGPVDSSPRVVPESAECLTSSVYSSPVVVSGTATFYRRSLSVSTLGSNVTSMILAAPNATAIPIKYAEVRVLDTSGTIVQCGVTNAAGAVKALDGTSNLTIPNTAGNYVVQVLARTNHIMTGLPGGKASYKVYVSIKSDIYSNEVYKISSSINSAGVGTVTPSLVAYARESESAEILGGAFNIFNAIVTSYTYLGQNTGTTNISCLNPKLEVYWLAGFNPAQYIYTASDPSTLGTLSFYLRGYNQLYINGGRLGNVTSQDTDHFDDSVIIHELGHHVEDVCGRMDSPGGTHYGLYRIDPRLAWSEGWGNFFGGHIIRNNLSSLNPNLSTSLTTTDGWLYYLDTKGYTEGAVTSGSEYIRVNLNKSGANPESFSVSGNTRFYDKVDWTLNPGEGHFRELSIARSLFKITNTCTALCTNCSSCANTNNFAKMWTAFENDSTGIGMGKSVYPFRSSARFYNRLNQAFAGSMPAAIDGILNANEAQQRDGNAAYSSGGYTLWSPYGIKLVKSVSACPMKIRPAVSLGLTTDSAADQRFSNHFYTVDLASLPGVTDIRMTGSFVSGSTHDLDLILFNQSYSYNQDCTSSNAAGDCTSYAKSTSTDAVLTDRSAGTTKQLSGIAALNSAAYYLLNVRSYPTVLPASASEYIYTLTDQSGGYLCPNASF
ncbi:MAG: hypothetical protein H7061_00235 [Bdellovibrionaceae bacterium]|nr:hypothetical protein [Bdellovibrio sp.]